MVVSYPGTTGVPVKVGLASGAGVKPKAPVTSTESSVMAGPVRVLNEVRPPPPPEPHAPSTSAPAVLLHFAQSPGVVEPD